MYFRQFVLKIFPTCIMILRIDNLFIGASEMTFDIWQKAGNFVTA